MLKKKYYNKRQSIMQMAWSVIGINQVPKLGKYSDICINLLMYAATVESAKKAVPQLSKRRIKVLRKKYLMYYMCTQVTSFRQVHDTFVNQQMSVPFKYLGG